MELLAPEKRRAVRMIREELCCKLCGRVFEDPHCLDCKHNFCRECIFLHLRKSDSSCPKCKLPTRPSEITKNQFLQSILSAWKAVEQSLGPLEDPDSAAVLEKQEREQEEAERAARQKRDDERAARGPVGNNKWNINTAELKQEAEAAERRANAIEMFGGSLAQRAALKSAALDATNSAAAATTATAVTSVVTDPPKPVTMSATTTPTRPIKLTGFGAAHLNKMANAHATPTRQNTQASAAGADDASQTQMPSGADSQMMSPPVHAVRRQSPFSPFEPPSPSGASLSSLSSPFSMMATQDVQGYMKKIQAQNHFLDDWAKKSKKTTSLVQLPITGFGAKGASPSVERKPPTISAVQRVQELMASSAPVHTVKRSPGKRKRQIFQMTTDSSDAEDEEDGDDGHTQTQMTGTMADSPDLLGFGNVAPPVAASPGARRRSLPAASKPFTVAGSRLSGAHDDVSDDDQEEDDEDADETWVDRSSTNRTASKSEPTTPLRSSRRRLVVQSSQAPPEVVDMTLDDDDDDDEEAVEDSQMPGSLVVPPAKKKRASNDFKEAISAFQQSGPIKSPGHLHRLSGANESALDSPPSTSPPEPAPAKVPTPTKGITGSTVAHKALGSRTSSVRSSRPPSTTRPPLSTAATSNSGRGRGRANPSSANYVFVGSDLSRDETKSVMVACTRLGGRFGRDFDVKLEPSGALTTSVTHLITKSVPTTHNGGSLGLQCKRTAKYMRALAEGTYVVDYSWVEASLAHGKWLPEDKYELSGDIYSDAVGKPRESRLRRLRTGNRNDIFRAFQFVLLCPESEFDFQLASLRAIVDHFGAPVQSAHTGNRVNVLPEAPRGKSNLGLVSKVMTPLDARRLYDIYQIPIVRVTWVFDSISHLEVLPFDDYYPY